MMIFLYIKVLVLHSTSNPLEMRDIRQNKAPEQEMSVSYEKDIQLPEDGEREWESIYLDNTYIQQVCTLDNEFTCSLPKRLCYVIQAGYPPLFHIQKKPY